MSHQTVGEMKAMIYVYRQEQEWLNRELEKVEEWMDRCNSPQHHNRLRQRGYHAPSHIFGHYKALATQRRTFRHRLKIVEEDISILTESIKLKQQEETSCK